MSALKKYLFWCTLLLTLGYMDVGAASLEHFQNNIYNHQITKGVNENNFQTAPFLLAHSGALTYTNNKFAEENLPNSLTNRSITNFDLKNLWIMLFTISSGVFLLLFLRQRKENSKFLVIYEKEKETRINKISYLERAFQESNSPLTLLNGYLKLIKEHKLNPNYIDNYVSKALNSSNLLIEKAKKLNVSVSNNATNLKLREPSFSINEFVLQALEKLKQKASIKNIKIQFRTNALDSLKLEFDSKKLHNIIHVFISKELLLNRGNSTITLEISINENELKISIMSPNSDIKKSTKNLNISKAIKEDINYLGGVFDFQFTSEIKTQTLNFPIKIEGFEFFQCPIRQTILGNDSVISDSKKSFNKQQYSILILENCPDFLIYYQEILNPIYNTILAFSYKEAVQKIKEHKFDLIISGICENKLQEKIYSSNLVSDIPVLHVMSGHQIDLNRKLSLVASDNYLVQPFENSEFITRINTILDKKNKTLNNKSGIQLKGFAKHQAYYVDLLTKINTIIVENLDDDDFGVLRLAQNCGYSHRQFSRVIKKVTGMTPNKLILEVRLQKAYEHIQNGRFIRLNEIRYSVGIMSVSYFNKTFVERFGIKPRALMEQLHFDVHVFH